MLVLSCAFWGLQGVLKCGGRTVRYNMKSKRNIGGPGGWEVVDTVLL